MLKIYNNGLLKLKNMDWFVVCASIYMHFSVWILFEIYYRDSIYDMLKQKEHMCKTFVRNFFNQKHVMNFWMA